MSHFLIPNTNTDWTPYISTLDINFSRGADFKAEVTLVSHTQLLCDFNAQAFLMYLFIFVVSETWSLSTSGKNCGKSAKRAL